MNPVPMFPIIVIAVAVFLLVRIFSRRSSRWYGAGWRACPRCGRNCEAHANFCPRCGQKL